MITKLKLYIPVDIGAIDGTIVEPPAIILVQDNGCIGIACAIPKAAIGVGVVFKGAIGAAADIPVWKKTCLLNICYLLLISVWY